MDIGIDDKTREKIAEGLARLLADSYTLYIKTHGFHWNVTGPMFNALHLMFMDQSPFSFSGMQADMVSSGVQ